ncbi:hypothetical protein ACOSQ2_016470 [Xanthoceras sorbifolium]
MDTRSKTNAEFRTKVTDILQRHEASFNQLNAALQTIMTEVQGLRMSRNSNTVDSENPFAPAESSHRAQSIVPTYPAPISNPSFHLERIALQWHRWLTIFRGPLTWVEFTKAVHLRFGPTDYEDPSEALTRPKQTTIVEAYKKAFEKLSHRVDNLPESFLVGCFIARLCDEIRLDVKVKQYQTLTDAIGVSRLIEERNSLLKKIGNGVNSRPNTNPHQRTHNNPSAGLLGPPPTTKIAYTPNPSVRRITSQEAKERRDKRLCFYCDEKYVLGHRCQRPQLFMIEDMPTYVEDEDTSAHEEQSMLEPLPEISFHAMLGTAHPQTLRMVGRIKNKEVTVLVDGGSTLNFIDQTVAQKLSLSVVRDRSFQVMVGNCEKIECVGRCLNLTLLI